MQLSFLNMLAVSSVTGIRRKENTTKSTIYTVYKGKGSPYSIAERRVPELIPVLGSQPAGDVSHKPDGKLPICHYFPPGPQLPSQPLRGLLPISLLGEHRHNGCKQFA